MTDTVGFISKLSHYLIKAFRSTLEEVSEADVLIHVVDYSNANYKKQMGVTRDTLKELGADNIPVIYCYNKIDLVEDKIPEDKEDCVYISTREKSGVVKSSSYENNGILLSLECKKSDYEKYKKYLI